jgi:hypothetical protein
MSQLVALSIAIAVLAAIATWAFLAVGSVLIWAAFLAWACFFHTGGDQNALKKTIVGNIFGVICGWVAAVVILGVPLANSLTLPVWAGIVVGFTVVVLCLAAHAGLLNVIPASVYGYAATFAFLLQTPEKLTLPKLTSASMENALIVVPVSMVIGALFALASGRLGAALQGSK